MVDLMLFTSVLAPNVVPKPSTPLRSSRIVSGSYEQFEEIEFLEGSKLRHFTGAYRQQECGPSLAAADRLSQRVAPSTFLKKESPYGFSPRSLDRWHSGHWACG